MERVLGNPGPGGWGAILMYGETKRKFQEPIKKQLIT